MALIVFCVALRATPNDIASLLRQPSLLVRSLFAMNVIVPLFAITLVLLFQVRHELAITLIALSVSPIPPFVPKKQIKASNDASYVIGLLAIVGVVSIVFVPGAVALLGWFSGHPLNVPVETIAWIIGTSVLAPIFAGMLVHAVAPPLAERIADGLSLASTILLLVCLLPVLISIWPAIWALIGNLTLVAIAVFVLFGLAAGHVLGGPSPGNRTVLALSAATRHPAVAFAIIKANLQPGATDMNEVLAAVILYLLFGAIVSLPYVKWRRSLLQAETAVTDAGADRRSTT